MTRWKLFVVPAVLVLFAATLSAGQEKLSPNWQSYDFSFRALNITSTGHSLWICGTDETIAVSSDDGAHWQVKHQTDGGGLLLNIDFADTKFGYAAGSAGLLLTTVDGGETWVQRPGMNQTILQVSFSDPQHGLLRTLSSLLFTADGGSHWAAVSAGKNSALINHFPFPFSLVALDGAHLAVMLKQGTAQYEPQAFLSTQDSGQSWTFVNIPNVTLYSFLRADGKYWAVGTEVVHKEKDGGYAVPVALYSSDGITWSHSNGDLSACKGENCTVCNSEGCLSSNGVISRIFSEKTSSRAFPPDKELTTKWAASDSAICFVGSRVQCAGLKLVAQAPENSAGPVPTVVGPGPLGVALPREPCCVVCGFDRLFVDKKVQGDYTVKLVVAIAKNGTVTSVVVQDAPTPEVKSRIEQQAQQWVFEPTLKDGSPVNVKLNTIINVNVIKAR